MTSWNPQAPVALEVPGCSIAESSPLYMTIQPDSLLSPVDPSFQKGASSLARFGLDIGGTLCQVVFFEPDKAQAEPKSRLFRTSFENEIKDEDTSCPNGQPEDLEVEDSKE